MHLVHCMGHMYGNVSVTYNRATKSQCIQSDGVHAWLEIRCASDELYHVNKRQCMWGICMCVNHIQLQPSARATSGHNADVCAHVCIYNSSGHFERMARMHAYAGRSNSISMNTWKLVDMMMLTP